MNVEGTQRFSSGDSTLLPAEDATSACEGLHLDQDARAQRRCGGRIAPELYRVGQPMLGVEQDGIGGDVAQPERLRARRQDGRRAADRHSDSR